MNQFLASVERRAFTMARLAVGNPDDALDIVQDAMLALVKNYRHRDRAEWRPLFFTILNNRITDWHRRRNTISRWQLLRERLVGDSAEDAELDPGDLPGPQAAAPDRALISERTLDAIDSAVGRLPLRQQQAFLLRCVEGFDVAETARAMSCSGGSVKTHLSRALATLRKHLEDLR
ncbi:RNA polymerase sigma factor [Microbulbifer thermotolerans]|uniref:RNA polymerase sigma factor n=1 Tax=Microbulbifer thermotolerans TaxID=252514 RepID=A0A143HKG7_MICTH|nr:RNA polymerase sigma factor [Microbulbifer thermotolerans]AMX02163.1 RNA polymerase subunit sigma-70 [Microbulbifer thermotolerans]MCX2784319.1 RNA polymerase sigma factor [Microbulbifer thermotolerans]MCX2793757.1 RNA polymerase sigma factor [Microbulbifer thermotolerans]MCX2800940.1 RNA polymerase sigma factor [Microbulbifer thermotolerans]MCX2830204.1 RNA polymerase sigma factor [Microbulbifer thermotolerans]